MSNRTPTIGPFACGHQVAIPSCPQCDNMLVRPTTAAFDGAGRVCMSGPVMSAATSFKHLLSSTCGTPREIGEIVSQRPLTA